MLCCSLFFSSPVNIVFIQLWVTSTLLCRISTSFPLFQTVVFIHLLCSNRMKLPIILLCEQKMDSSPLTEYSSIFHLLLWCILVIVVGHALAVVVQVPRFKDCFIWLIPSNFLFTKMCVLQEGLIPVAFIAFHIKTLFALIGEVGGKKSVWKLSAM